MWPVLFSWAFFLSGSPVSVLSQIVTVEDSDKAGYKTTKPGRVCRAGVVKIVWLKTYEICLFNKSARMAGLESGCPTLSHINDGYFIYFPAKPRNPAFS